MVILVNTVSSVCRDNAVWDEDQEAAAQKIVMNHAKHAASVDRKGKPCDIICLNYFFIRCM